MNDHLDDNLEAYADQSLESYIVAQQVRAMNKVIEKEAFAKPRDIKKKFWMLYAEGGSAPSHKHGDYMEAMMEAKRLMDTPNFKGARIYVLEATGVVEAKITKEFIHTEIKYEK